MAKYVWQDNGALAITLSDAEGAQPDLVFQPTATSADTQLAATRFGFQTALRNATAGKMDDLDEARKALLARAKVFMETGWKSESEGAGKIELTQEEKDATVARVLCINKRANGDKRTDVEILTAFGGLDDEKKVAVLASIAKPIEKALKQALRDKRTAVKNKVADF